jgi:hypothetical protein
MTVERVSSPGLVDVLDRVLDKGIVIDAWIRLSVVGLDVLTVEARVVVASIATYVQRSEMIAGAMPLPPASLTAPPPAPAVRPRRRRDDRAGNPGTAPGATLRVRRGS